MLLPAAPHHDLPWGSVAHAHPMCTVSLNMGSGSSCSAKPLARRRKWPQQQVYPAELGLALTVGFSWPQVFLLSQVETQVGCREQMGQHWQAEGCLRGSGPSNVALAFAELTGCVSVLGC